MFVHLHCLSSFKTRVVLELNTKNVSVTFANRELYSNIWRPAIAFVSVKNVFVFFSRNRFHEGGCFTFQWRGFICKWIWGTFHGRGHRLWWEGGCPQNIDPRKKCFLEIHEDPPRFASLHTDPWVPGSFLFNIFYLIYS